MESILAITRALSDENRVRALMALGDQEVCVCQLIELLQLAPSTVSKHMSVLKQARLVAGARRGDGCITGRRTPPLRSKPAKPWYGSVPACRHRPEFGRIKNVWRPS